MFDPSSRYYDLQNKTLTIKNSKLNKNTSTTVTYKERRFIPVIEKYSMSKEMTISSGERLDSLSYKLLGDPEKFWQLCDMNNIYYPPSLTDNPGSTVIVGIQTYNE